MKLEDLRQLAYLDLDEDPASPRYYTDAEVRDALNEAERFFCLLTLCLETTRPFALTPGVRFYPLPREWHDWIAPLRVRLSSDVAEGITALDDGVTADTAMPNEQAHPGLVASATPKLAPSTMSEMWGLNSDWLTATGYPERYGCLGFDLLFLDKVATLGGVKLLITYARSPRPMVLDTDAPEILEADHHALVDGAVSLLRMKEGGDELAGAMAGLGRYLQVAAKRAAQGRGRSLAQRYDKLPLELERYDFSRLLKIRPDLAPHRKGVPNG